VFGELILDDNGKLWQIFFPRNREITGFNKFGKYAYESLGFKFEV